MKTKRAPSRHPGRSRARRFGSRALPLLGLALACAGGGPASPTLVDLTHTFDADTVYWPTAREGFVHVVGAAGPTDAGYWYEAHAFRAPEHGGTHIDAPSHFAEGGDPVDRIPLARLVAPAVRVDLRARADADPDLAIGEADLRAFEAEHGPIPAGAIVLLSTGWSRRWPDAERYLGTAARGEAATSALRFPGLAADGARFLAVQRKIAAVGIDTASIDPGRSRSFEAHRVLAAHGIPALENLTGLERLPVRGFHVFALPMKIGAGSGGPLRAIAVWGLGKP